MARYCSIWRKIHGLALAARPIMTASQPVSRTMRTASSGVTISPLPITGILTAAFTSAMRRPIGLARCSPARACADAAPRPAGRNPRPGAPCRTATSSRSFHPARNFMVNGNGDGLAHLAQQPLHQRQVAQQAGAAVALHHFVHRAAEIEVEDVEAQVLADARGVGHHRRIGAEKLRRNGMLFRFEGQVLQRLAWACGAPSEALTPCELVNSVMISPQPPRLRMKRRKTVSVTPAMGASTVAGAIFTGPMEKWVGNKLISRGLYPV